MTLFIDDTYLSENYPIPFSVDAKRLAAVINMTQKTFMRDILGDPLYEAFKFYIEDGEPEDDKISYIADDVKMLQCLYTAKGLYATYYTSEDNQTRDANIQYIIDAIKLYEDIITRKIASVEYLSELASTESANDSANNMDTYSSIYYPTESYVTTYTPSDLPVEIVSFNSDMLFEVGTTNTVTVWWEVSGAVKTQKISYNGELKQISRNDRDYTLYDVSKDTTVTLYVNNKSESVNIKFTHPSYTGVFNGDIDSITGTIVVSGEKLILGSREYEGNYTCDFNRLFFAYPKEFGDLTKITDENGFDAFDVFDKKELEINKVKYNIYVSNLDAKFDNLKYKFI